MVMNETNVESVCCKANPALPFQLCRGGRLHGKLDMDSTQPLLTRLAGHAPNQTHASDGSLNSPMTSTDEDVSIVNAKNQDASEERRMPENVF
mmetsp:Transcript_30879/g.52262  ORF Transcript_30879/g.52262 Transcript_30879/m.52262 type:complete len:93 (+) Transcript_30879:104-382(+)